MRTRSATGFTLVELLIVVAVVGVIAAISIPGLLRARMAGNEASAIGSLRAINSGQASYSTSCAQGGGYAVALEDLVKPAPGANTQGFVSPDLSANGVTKSGYTVVLEKDGAPGTIDIGTAAATCNGSISTPASSYFAKTDPISMGTSGNRYFATDKRGTIYYDTTGPIANPIPSGATFVQ